VQINNCRGVGQKWCAAVGSSRCENVIDGWASTGWRGEEGKSRFVGDVAYDEARDYERGALYAGTGRVGPMTIAAGLIRCVAA